MADDTSERHPDFLELCGPPKCFLVNCIKSAGANNIKEDDLSLRGMLFHRVAKEMCSHFA